MLGAEDKKRAQSHKFEQEVLKTISFGHLFEPGERVVVAVSGGGDSVAMLFCLANLAQLLDLSLHVAHVHHGLRGLEADADALLVQAHASQLGLPFTLQRVDVAHHRTAGHTSLQDAARRARYQALRSLCAEIGATAVATAHTHDDQAETVLMHLLRGSGLTGISGMRERQGDLVRPFLRVSHERALAYCHDRRVEWHDDRSNSSFKYRRNAVRHVLMPALEAFNPRVRDALVRLADSAALDAAFLDGEAQRALATILLSAAEDGAEAPALAVDRAGYAALPAALRLQVLRKMISALVHGTHGVTHEHLLQLDHLVLHVVGGSDASLPHRLRAECTETRFVLGVGRNAGPVDVSVAAVPLEVPGTARFGDWVIESRIEPIPRDGLRSMAFEDDRFTAWCACDAARDLSVRTRLKGDRVRPFGMAGTRKLQDVFVDRKVPRAERDETPLVVSGTTILWVVGVLVSEETRIGGEAADGLVLRARRVAKTPTPPHATLLS